MNATNTDSSVIIYGPTSAAFSEYKLVFNNKIITNEYYFSKSRLRI